MEPKELINFWEQCLRDKGLYSPSMIVLIEHTVKLLKELVALHLELADIKNQFRLQIGMAEEDMTE